MTKYKSSLESILKCQMETLELENKFIEIKNSVNAFNTRLDETKESINILKK